MRFSTVAAVSAAVLAGSTVAVPVSGSENNLAASGAAPAPIHPHSDHSTSSKSTSGHRHSKLDGTPSGIKPKSSRIEKKPHNRLTKGVPVVKPKPQLTAEQQGQLGLDGARTEYQSAESEYKKAEAALAAARTGEQKALNEMGFSGINNNFGSRSLDADEILGDLAARALFEDEELFARTPDVHPIPKSTSGTKRPRPNGSSSGNKQSSHRSGGKLPGNRITKPISKIPVKPKLTADQQGQLGLDSARTEYQSAESEYKKAEAALAAARTGEQKALNEEGLGGINKNFRRDVDSILEDLAARGFFDEDELFARTPSVAPVPKSTSGKKHPKTNGAPVGNGVKNTGKQRNRLTKGVNVRPKLTADQQGQLGLDSARTEYHSAESEYKKAEAALAAARTGEQKALNEEGLGGINKNFRRSLDVDSILEDLAARGFFDEDDELFARTTSVHELPIPAHSGTGHPIPARNKALIMDAVRKGEKQALDKEGFGFMDHHLGLRSLDIEEDLAARDVDVEELMSIIARGYYDAL